ncbi:hypothetical protein A6S26_33005 [Nostoc sp. ATCC 43529]|nr:hypothetical protein A6S26_33005 [Nostoc sp. ATCC 43529]
MRFNADLQQSANLENANVDAISLKDADLHRARLIIVNRIVTAIFEHKAIYYDNFRKELGLFP